MKKQFKFIILFIVIFIFLIFHSSCVYGYNVLPVFDDIIGDNNLWFIYKTKSNDYYLKLFNAEKVEYTGHYKFNTNVYDDQFHILVTGMVSSSLYKYNVNNHSWDFFNSETPIGSSGYHTINRSDDYLDDLCYSNFNLRNYTPVFGNNDIVFSTKYPVHELPFISNTNSVLSTGNFDYLCINSGDFYADNWEDFYLLCYDYSNVNDENLDIYPRKEIAITGGSNNKYFTNVYYDSYIFMIPLADLGLDFRNNCNYCFKLATKIPIEFDGQIIEKYNYFYEEKFTVLELSAEQQAQNSQDRINSQLDEQGKKIDKQTDAINNQTEVLKEQEKTNKGILQTIIELPGKVANFIIDGLKSLFIPSNDFISNFFTNLKNWFSDRFGFLFYPFGLIIDILNRIININFSEPIFNVPDIYEPFTNSKLINNTTYNLNSLLANSIFNNLHNIYLLCVDAFIIFGLVNLAKFKFNEVMKQ